MIVWFDSMLLAIVSCDETLHEVKPFRHSEPNEDEHATADDLKHPMGRIPE
jgi:hypothetical protein